MLNAKSRCSPKYWNGKPYNFFGDYLHERFRMRILKLSLDAHLGCPNRDGTFDRQGCIFCAKDGSASPTAAFSNDIHLQMKNARESFRRGNVPTGYIAYFQAFTNTYAPVEKLKKLYDSAISFDDVVGLMIGTRPDCLPEDVLDLIASYKNKKNNFELWLEIGMQTIHNTSLQFLNRHHTHSQTLDAITRAAQRGIDICLHIILGIPGESFTHMMETANEISQLPVSGIKLHHLHVIKDTKLEKLYRTNNVRLLTFNEYVSIACDFLERIRGDILIHRLSGDRDINTLVAPSWGLHKGTIIKAIEDQFRRRGTYQGFLCER
ncbi:MAG: TIGR01212 family radical SAM protein [Spirochaetes bacterium]|nr:TIGR01212 family radical SAM protein [Spirochaetota bacterium]